MAHPIHKAVALAIESAVTHQSTFVRDFACDERDETCVRQQIPLFRGQKGRGTQLCKVDLLVIVSNQVRIIVEIEESAFKPTTVCGKFLTAALATHYRHKCLPDGNAPLDRVLFIQVMKTGHLKETSKKPEQYETIEQALATGFSMPNSPIVKYQIFQMKDEHDQPVLDLIRDSVRDHLAPDCETEPLRQ